MRGRTLSGRGALHLRADRFRASSAGTAIGVSGLLLLTACTGEQVTEVTVISVTISPPSVSAVAGERVQLNVTIEDENGEALAGAVPHWSSGDSAIASVDAEGVVEARAEGSADVWATYRGIVGRATVRVLPGPGIAVSHDSIAMAAGAGGSPPRPEELHVTNDGNGTLAGLSVRVHHPEGIAPWLRAEIDSPAAPATVTLTAEPGALSPAEHRAELEISSSLAGVATVRVPVTLTLLGFSVEETDDATVVSESGGRDSLLVTLRARPREDVVLTVSTSDVGEVTAAPGRLTFTTDDWSDVRVVALAGVDDALVDGDRSSRVTVSVDEAASDEALAGVPDWRIDVTTLDDDRAGLAVRAGGATSVDESGTSRSFTVALMARPTSDVVVSVASGDESEVSVSPSTLSFDPASWDVEQTVTVTGVDDAVTDGDQVTVVTIAVDEADSDAAYAGAPAETLEFTTLDDDASGLTVVESGGSTRVSESGTSDGLAVSLTAQPATNVVLAVTSADPGEVTVAPSGLTFTPANWSTAQTVTVTGVDDLLADGEQTSVVSISVNVPASDPAYAAVSAATVVVATADDDVASFSVTQSGGGTIVSEDGDTDDVTVVLTAQPETAVVLTVTSADPGEVTVAPATLTFAPADWSAPQTVTVTGVDDFVDDGAQTTTVRFAVDPARSDPAFGGAPDGSIVATTIDNDEPAGITITEIGGTTVSEAGGSDAFTVVLTSQPERDVVLRLASEDLGEVEVAPATLTFASDDWDQAATVTVTGVDDAVQDGDQTTAVTVRVEPSLSDPAYAPVAPVTVSVTTTDDDRAAVTLQESDGATAVGELGPSDDVTVVLGSEPVGDVVLSVSIADPDQAVASPATLRFTAGDWSVPQTVTVSGVDDSVVDGPRTTTLTVAVDPGSPDAIYAALAPVTIDVSVGDDDLAAFGVTESGGSTVVSESGTSDDLSVVLGAQPLSDVVLTVTSSDTGEVSVAPATLRFTPASWNVPQAVTVTGVDDLLPDGDVAVTVTVAIDPSASDPAFAGLGAFAVTVTNVDNELLRPIGP